jgi:hypothetical protein
MRTHKVFLLAIALVNLQATAATESIIDSESTAPNEVTEAIEEIILQWAYNWSNSRWERIQDFWDPDEEAPYYLGEERKRWLIGREGFQSYFTPPGQVRSLMGGVIMVPYRLRVRLVSDDIAIAIWENRLDMDIRGRPPINDNFRANAVFRKKPEGWMFIHYAEAPLAPLPYLEHLYRKSVTPGYAEIAKPMDPD